MAPRGPQEAPRRPPRARGPKRPPSGTQDAPRGLGEDAKTASARKPQSLVLRRLWPHFGHQGGGR
eukprot:7157727-Pyramimonas_sp.AAC.1